MTTKPKSLSWSTTIDDSISTPSSTNLKLLQHQQLRRQRSRKILLQQKQHHQESNMSDRNNYCHFIQNHETPRKLYTEEEMSISRQHLRTIVSKLRIHKKQQRLVQLYHAAKCVDGMNCTNNNKCKQFKMLWQHMEYCNDDQCGVSHCYSSRRLLAHHLKCPNHNQCLICSKPTHIMKSKSNIHKTNMNSNKNNKNINDNTKIIQNNPIIINDYMIDILPPSQNSNTNTTFLSNVNDELLIVPTTTMSSATISTLIPPYDHSCSSDSVTVIMSNVQKE